MGISPKDLQGRPILVLLCQNRDQAASQALVTSIAGVPQVPLEGQHFERKVFRLHAVMFSLKLTPCGVSTCGQQNGRLPFGCAFLGGSLSDGQNHASLWAASNQHFTRRFERRTLDLLTVLSVILVCLEPKTWVWSRF